MKFGEISNRPFSMSLKGFQGSNTNKLKLWEWDNQGRYVQSVVVSSIEVREYSNLFLIKENWSITCLASTSFTLGAFSHGSNKQHDALIADLICLLI